MFFLTGANGWLGLSIAEALRESTNPAYKESRGLVLPGSETAELASVNPSMTILQGDVRDVESLAKFFEDGKDGILIHTVGVIHPKKVSEFYAVNYQGTKNVLESACKAGVKRAVIISSNSPCGCNPHPDHQFDESSPYNPYMNYGRSKMLMEQMVLDDQWKGKIEVAIIRAPWFYGPHQPPRQKLFFEMIRKGKAPIVGHGENLRSMAYTANLAQGALLAAQTPQAAGQVYWIADERPYSMNEIVDTIERLLETEFGQQCAHKRLHLPGLASEVAYFMDAALQSLGLYHQKIHVLSEMNKTIACSVEKAQRELGYRPYISLEEGMRRSLREIYR